MDCTKLDELISIKKKSDASNSAKIEYRKCIESLLMEEGICDNSMKYVYSGFSFCGAVPLYNYLKKCEKEALLDNIKSVFAYESFAKNENGIAVKMALHLLYFLFLSSDNLDENIIFLLRSFNKNSKSKDGGFRKDLSKVVEKYFVNCIGSEDDLRSFNTSEIDNVCFAEFITIMVYASNGITPLKAKHKKSFAIFNKWIGNLVPVNSVLSEDTTRDRLTSASDSEALMTESDMLHTIEYLMNSMPELNSVLSQVLFRYKKLIETAGEADAYRQQLEQANEKIELCKDQLKSVSEQIEDLTSQKHSLMYQVTKVTEQLNAVIADNERLKKIISVYSVDKTDSQNEQLNAIASRLKAEYRDFKEAEEMEMSIDLGENLRVQMKSVFKILAKSGIDVEGR